MDSHHFKKWLKCLFIDHNGQWVSFLKPAVLVALKPFWSVDSVFLLSLLRQFYFSPFRFSPCARNTPSIWHDELFACYLDHLCPPARFVVRAWFHATDVGSCVPVNNLLASIHKPMQQSWLFDGSPNVKVYIICQRLCQISLQMTSALLRSVLSLMWSGSDKKVLYCTYRRRSVCSRRLLWRVQLFMYM